MPPWAVFMIIMLALELAWMHYRLTEVEAKLIPTMQDQKEIKQDIHKVLEWVQTGVQPK